MIMSNKDLEEYHNIGLDTATKVFNKFKDGTLDYLELDLNFNDYKVKTEFNAIEPYYVEHREDETHKGWESCCLHGLGIDQTRVAKEYGYDDELNAPYDWTPLQKLAPTAKKFWEDFPAEKAQLITQGQVLKVKPGQGGLRARIKDQDLKLFAENQERIAIEVSQLKDKLDAVENRQIGRLGQFERVIDDFKRVIICWDDLQDD